MTDASDEGQSAKLGEVARLATLMADRILEAQITGRQIQPEQFTALVSAAQLLEDHNAPWPPLLEQVLFEAGRRFSEADATHEAADPQTEGEGVVASLTRFFSGFRRS